jgi:hypothetical protein
MQRHIEALLLAYLADRDKEARVVQELLAVLAVGAADRERMLRDLQAAVSGLAAASSSEATSHLGENAPPSSFGNDLSAAISKLRDTRVAMAD